MSSQVTVIGSATRDRIVHGEVSHHKWGGVAVYAGLTFARLGMSTGVVTNLADRDSALADLLSSAGISVQHGNSDATTEFVNHVSGDERRQELLSCAASISKTQLGQITADHVHLGPLHPLDIEPPALMSLQDVERVSIDIQGYTRKIEGVDVRAGVSGHLRHALDVAEIVKASREETEAVVDFFGEELGALMEECGIEQWLTTDGANGGWLLCSSGSRHDFRGVAVSEIADPTGAGDVFFAAYLTYHLYEEADIGEALQQAATLTARQVEGRFIAGEELSRAQD
jgi:sugar/nucleoside kinase (ribokinase family)